MQMKRIKKLAGFFTGMIAATAAVAHPGHAPTDVVAEVSQPLAGLDHLAAFLALATILLVVLRLVLSRKQVRQRLNLLRWK